MKKLLFIYARGGAPLEHALPRLAAHAELHVLAVTPPPDATRDRWLPACASFVDRSWQRPRGDSLVDLIAGRAQEIGAEAVTCLSEFVVVAVARAAGRLGLVGAGRNIDRARDKRSMRETWQHARVPIPSFRPVDSVEDLERAVAELRAPVLLKPAWGAGSIGQIPLRDRADVAPAWAETRRALSRAADSDFAELYHRDAYRDFLVEEIVSGSTAGWYDEPGYGDYLSVEGIVAGGRYHPLCITARLPTVEPFTELSNNAPCVLPEPLQRRIELVATQAVDALGLDTCGTHTEIKLAPDGRLSVIESAARFGGCMVTKEVETVFGLEPIGMLARELLGEPVWYPPAMLTTADLAAASLALIPVDAAGVPWTSTPIWQPSAVDWAALIAPGSTIEVVPGLTVPEGTRLKRYDPSAGAGNWAGIFFLTARDARTLLSDCQSVLNHLERALDPTLVRRAA